MSTKVKKEEKSKEKKTLWRFVWMKAAKKLDLTIKAPVSEVARDGSLQLVTPGKTIRVINGVYETEDKDIAEKLMACNCFRDTTKTPDEWPANAHDPSKAFTLVSDEMTKAKATLHELAAGLDIEKIDIGNLKELVGLMETEEANTATV